MDPRAFVHAEQVFFYEPYPQAWELGRRKELLRNILSTLKVGRKRWGKVRDQVGTFRHVGGIPERCLWEQQGVDLSCVCDSQPGVGARCLWKGEELPWVLHLCQGGAPRGRRWQLAGIMLGWSF